MRRGSDSCRCRALQAGVPWQPGVPLQAVQTRTCRLAAALCTRSTSPVDAVPLGGAQAPELLDMGAALWDALEALPRRVAVLISGDLAHTHDTVGGLCV